MLFSIVSGNLKCENRNLKYCNGQKRQVLTVKIKDIIPDSKCSLQA